MHLPTQSSHQGRERLHGLASFFQEFLCRHQLHNSSESAVLYLSKRRMCQLAFARIIECNGPMIAGYSCGRPNLAALAKCGLYENTRRPKAYFVFHGSTDTCAGLGSEQRVQISVAHLLHDSKIRPNSNANAVSLWLYSPSYRKWCRKYYWCCCPSSL